MARRNTAATRSPRTRRRLITPGDLTRLHIVSDPRIAPDGKRILFSRKHVGEKNEYITNLWMVDADGKSDPVPFTNGGKDSHGRFSPDGRRIAFISGRDKPKPQIYLIDVDGGEARALTDFPEGSIGTFKWSPDGKTIAVSFRQQDPQWTEEAKREREEKKGSDPPRVIDHRWYRLDGDGYFNAQRYQLYLVDVETGAHRRVYARDTLGLFTFDFAPDSKRLVIATNRDRRAGLKAWNDDLMILDIASGRLKKIPDLPRGPKERPAFSPDGRHIAYAGRIGTEMIYSVENLELFVCDPARGNARSFTGDEDCCLLAVCIGDTADVDFGPSFRWSRDSRRVFMKVGWHGEAHIASVGLDGGAIVFHTSGAAEHDMGNLSDDGKRMALTKATPQRPPEIHLGSVAARSMKTEALTDINGSFFRGLNVAKTTSRRLTSADGTKVQTWIMTPPDFEAGGRKRYPAVLEIHGGPHGQYGVGYFHEFQVLAAAGYIVFFSNPRGSKGYGRDHCAAIKGSWGGADWVDLQAVIDAMKDHPHVNPKRMGVMGGSYGGYMTNWIIGHTDDFAGAITDRCVSNVVTMGGTSDFIELPDDYFPGNFWDRPEARWEQSPIKYLGNVNTPTLIIHSEGDLRCNIEQSEQVFAALTLRKVPTRFVRYPRSTSHGLSRGGPPDMRLHRLGQILEWWREYL
ncbi:MAG: S9 family peptidase [Planctomycetota bacterium]|nr:S9 family peptidase [Planctomycetota bacterium]